MNCGLCKQTIPHDAQWYEVRRLERLEAGTNELFYQNVCVPCMERADAAAQLTYIRTYTPPDPSVFIPEHSHQMKG